MIQKKFDLYYTIFSIYEDMKFFLSLIPAFARYLMKKYVTVQLEKLALIQKIFNPS